MSIRTAEELAELMADYCAVPKAPINHVPEQIIFRKLVVHPTNYDLSIYEKTFVPRTYKPDRFDELIEDIAIYGYASHKLDRREHNALDISVYDNSIIIVQLPLEEEYEFDDPGIVLKKNASGQCPSDLYGGLRYVDEAGVISEAKPDNCKLLFFHAAHQPGTVGNPYTQSFLYNVPPLPIRFRMIDPDIRHPGNGDSNPEP